MLLTGCNYNLAGALLAHGAELNPVLWAGETLLHVAIHWGRLSSAQWLLEKGANPNTVREKDDWTPLHKPPRAALRASLRSYLSMEQIPK